MITRKSVGTFKSNPRYALAMVATKIPTPKSAKVTLSIPQWKEAMEKEFQALQANGIWTLIPRQPNDNVINTKWVFIVKTKEDGSIERFKVQLVANGMRQVHGLDYLNTFSPVVKPISIRLVLTLAVT